MAVYKARTYNDADVLTGEHDITAPDQDDAARQASEIPGDWKRVTVDRVDPPAD